jgi:hypothetical protein
MFAPSLQCPYALLPNEIINIIKTKKPSLHMWTSMPKKYLKFDNPTTTFKSQRIWIDHNVNTKVFYMAHTIWGGGCYSNNSWRAYSTYWTFRLASINCDFQSPMLNFKPIRWSYNPLFFSWSYLTQSLVNFYTSCLRFATVSTLVIHSSHLQD